MTDATPPTPTPPGSPSEPTAPQAALADAVREIEHHVAAAGWDAPVRVFALVRTQAALAAEPGLADQLEPATLAAARASAWHLTSIEQEGLPAAPDLESLLAGLSWPPAVDGVAVTAERIVLPPAAEAAMPQDAEAALPWLLAHPQREDVRLAVGVLREGATWSVVRTRAHDSDDAVGQGADVVPGLVAALRATLD
ncbi:PPA1309 family protein [Cellulomonas sp.]|uniref:PPA1309 family protein n=1 Tax=Cellulomonas sp. TaxID=40001 RepID=UPI0025832545|nr:PPA1309 family protein [Cellulomonas sp.]MCR6690638.1 PPA1309 family protein [Cellulomonas sp.]